ncbi:hypothetical protein Tco_0443463 [Tanacetum coccineum]
MITLVEFMIIAGADNRPPMLEKSMYESWKSRMELYMENRENRRMILDSIINGPLVWPTVVQEDGTTKKQKSLFKTAGLLCNKFKRGKDKVMLVLAIRVMLLVLGETIHEGRQGLLNAIIFKDKAMLAEAQESGQILNEEQLAFLVDLSVLDGQAIQTTIPNNAAFQTEDLDAYNSDCDDVSNARTVLMANLSNYCSDVISEVPHSKPYHNDMDNQSVYAMQDFEQTPVVDFLDNEITSDSNIILYSQYLQETQQEAVQDTNLYA